jgi:hypothetical protein
MGGRALRPYAPPPLPHRVATASRGSVSSNGRYFASRDNQFCTRIMWSGVFDTVS